MIDGKFTCDNSGDRDDIQCKCGLWKRKGNPFCKKHMEDLPDYLRREMNYTDPGVAYDAYSVAIRYLQMA